jgi:hypothetical protein
MAVGKLGLLQFQFVVAADGLCCGPNLPCDILEVVYVHLCDQCMSVVCPYVAAASWFGSAVRRVTRDAVGVV